MMNGNVKQKVQLEISSAPFNSFFAEMEGLAMVGFFYKVCRLLKMVVPFNQVESNK